MKKLEEIAFRAISGALPAKFTPEDYTNWNRVSEALEQLTPEQRCDVVYADWLICLNGSSGSTLLGVRNDLIHNGALAANYLAELAQNADDASDGAPAEFRVLLRGNWLLVANNGRKVTPKNLLGLCRFFVHFGREAVELNHETIGRFGIGFKSSYYLADEVLVESWDSNGEFVFRLPICDSARQQSNPDADRLARIQRQLEAVGCTITKDTVELRYLGFCTPEFMPALPEEVRAMAAELKPPERGSLFCFHLHERGLDDVTGRIRGQREEVYELCPLFLPNLRCVQLGPNQLTMQVHPEMAGDGLPGQVVAERVTLTTILETGKQAHSRFWRLRGTQKSNDVWQLALHADSDFRLSVEKVKGEEDSTSVKDGGAYSFFPLNAVNASWPLRLHLHLELPTELSRRDWNHQRPEDHARVDDQIRRAIQGMAAWLETHLGKWHPEWRVEQLLKVDPGNVHPGHWGSRTAILLKEAMAQRLLVKDCWGEMQRAPDVIPLHLPAKGHFAEHWRRLCGFVPDLRSDYGFAIVSGGVEFGYAEESEQTVRQFLLRALPEGAPIEHRISWLCSVCSWPNASQSFLENLLNQLQVERNNGKLVALRELFAAVEGTELRSEWHETFSRLNDWLSGCPLRDHTVFGDSLAAQIRKLSKPLFNPAWEDVPVELGAIERWQTRGEEFWQRRRVPCQKGIQNVVLQTLRMKDGNEGWKPVTDFWVCDDDSPICFHGLLISCRPRAAAIRSKLIEWGLFEEYQTAVRTNVEARLARRIADRLTEYVSADPFDKVFSTLHEQLWNKRSRDWQQLIRDAEDEGIRLFLQTQAESLTEKSVLAREIPAGMRSLLLRLPNVANVPEWLTELASNYIRRALSDRRFQFLTPYDIVKHGARFAEQLLQSFHTWRQSALSAPEETAFEAICAPTPVGERNHWAVGLTLHQREFLNRLVTEVPTTEGQIDEDNRQLLRLTTVKWHCKRLPQELQHIPSLAKACISPLSLNCQVTFASEPMPIRLADVSADMSQRSLFDRILKRKGWELCGCRAPIQVRWSHDTQVVADLLDADFALHRTKLVTSRVVPPKNTKQYDDVLGIYARCAPDDREFHAERETEQFNSYELYQRHRPKIRKALLKELVEGDGYEPQHIVRELLQNAESAYASKSNVGDASERLFELSGHAGIDANTILVEVRHQGRTFNERDRDNNAREDIQRIVSLDGKSQRLQKEIGKFNRGFKSVFHVTDSVDVVSGQYKFRIKDLLLLDPPRPDEQPVFKPGTVFRFSCEKGAYVRMLKYDSAKRSLGIFNASTFAFLSEIVRISLRFEDMLWDWRINRTLQPDGWMAVKVTQHSPISISETFLVRRGTLPEPTDSRQRSFGVALRWDEEHNVPKSLADGWHKLRLTFELRESFPLDFLVNGDFDVDRGRIGQQHTAATMRIVEAALCTLTTFCATDLLNRNSKERWLAWAEVIHLSDLGQILADNFPDNNASLLRTSESIEQILLGCIPCANGSARLSHFDFPSKLMRRAARYFAEAWGLRLANWIDEAIEKRLPTKASKKHEDKQIKLPGFITNLAESPTQLQGIQWDLQTQGFRQGLDAIEQNELREAENLLHRLLHPILPTTIVKGTEIEQWSENKLWSWWTHEKASAEQYTLVGDDNWSLFFPGDNTAANQRPKRLRECLTLSASEEGLAVWYRLLAFACLLSARGRTETLRAFWREKLENRGFWKATSLKCDYGSATRDLFGNLVLREHQDTASSGEWADYWRHVFYDVRKVHELVWQHRFAETIVQLVLDPRRAADLPLFLRSGQLAGQRGWAGVLGQSSGAPLFFVARELCRLGLPASPELKRLAFFPCTPVRRAAASIGWLEPSLAESTDFNSLAKVSERLYQCAAGHAELVELFDIPLLHMGLTSDLLPPAFESD